MKRETESSLKAMAGAGAGSLLGALVGSKYPSLASKVLGKNIPERVLSLASGGTGAAIGASLGKDLVGNSLPEVAGGEIGLLAGAPLGALASIPFIKQSQKGKLLKFLLGTGIGSVAGIGGGTYLGSKLGVNSHLEKLTGEHDDG